VKHPMENNKNSTVVIIGAGHGGGSMVSSLRQAGHAGKIVMIGDEPIVPYHRPPLSKAYLQGEVSQDSLKLRPDHFYAEAGVELKLGASVTAIDTTARMVHIANDAPIAYDILVLATGSRARRLEIPGADLAGIHYLRTVADADALRDAIGPGRRLAIVGGGYVGLEAAASALALGADVMLIEREARLLARVACEPLAAFFDAYHRDRGVNIVTGVEVQDFTGDAAVTGLQLSDGREMACDAVLVGVGGIPCDDLARSAGLACENGVVVDEMARTSVAGVYAIGDMTWRPLPLYGGRRFRLESVPNAAEQARCATAHILGKAPPAPEVPWFWSDQYDLKLQIAGIPFDSHRLVVRGSIDTGRFAIFHLAEDGTVLAVEAVNMPQEFMAGRMLIGARRSVDADRLADLAVSMKEIAKG
jgi:3-phenylpropionate/trans-cinnamate dioxygenase ferredoxin reductase subunit